jgi:biopolymer transport protein ExbD
MVECPNCSSCIKVPGEDQPSLPKVEFAEAKEPGGSPIWSDSEVEELSLQTSPEVSDDLQEPPIPRESETPSGDRGGSVQDGLEETAPIRFRRAISEFEEMDLTPMVDVTFLLLIFFMITASFTLEKTIPTPVPDPNEQSASQPIQQQEELLEKSILIGIESDNTITIDDEPLPNAQMLEKRLIDVMTRDQKAEALVTVADRAMQETVVYVLDTANEVKMQKIRLAVAPSEAD